MSSPVRGGSWVCEAAASPAGGRVVLSSAAETLLEGALDSGVERVEPL